MPVPSRSPTLSISPPFSILPAVPSGSLSLSLPPFALLLHRELPRGERDAPTASPETQQRLIPSAPTRDGGACFTFTGQPLACDELELARRFNREEMPTLLGASYADVRRAMTEYGLYGSSWHVGHARPDPNKRRTNDDEDRGHNLLAQHATDNMKLGHVLISCAESKFLHAAHVKCR